MDKVKHCSMEYLFSVGYAYILVILVLVSTTVLSEYTSEHVKPLINNRQKTEYERNGHINMPLYSAEMDNIKIEGSYFVDQLARVTLFHGLNSVLKKPPWYHTGLLNDTKIKSLQHYGFNVVRLGMMWSGVMPEAGKVNTSYVDIMKSIVRNLGSRGVYVILDMHQDVLSSEFHAYDGMPRWLADKLPPPRHRYPWPLPHTPANWFNGYLTEAVGEAFQGIYDNVAGSRDALLMFWRTVAKSFKSERNVLGYELINEPWAGDIYSYPSLLLPGVAGRKNLQPLYDKLNDVIRQEDQEKIIFFEPVTWGMVFTGTKSGSGFTHVPGGLDYVNKSAFAYHYYCWVLTASEAHLPYPAFQRTLCDKILGPQVFKTVQKDISKIGGASFLTEFGLCGPDGQVNSTTTLECDYVLKQTDNFLQSWTYWGGEEFQDINISSWDSVAPFVRTYAQKIAGVPQQMQFDLKSKIFTIKYVYNPAYQNISTEIFVPDEHYPSGFVIVKPAMVSSTFNKQTRLLYLKVTDLQTELKVNIYIKPV